MAEAARAPNRRVRITRWIVPHSVFGWFVGALAAGTAVITTILAASFWWHHTALVTSLGGMGLLQNPTLAREIGNYTQILLIMTAGGSILFIGFVTILGAFLVHKLVGPIYRLERHLERAANGEKVRPLSFRAGDRFGEVAGPINELLNKAGLLEDPP